MESPGAADTADRGEHRQDCRRGHSLKDDASRLPEQLSCHQRHTDGSSALGLATYLVILKGDDFEDSPFDQMLHFILETPCKVQTDGT